MLLISESVDGASVAAAIPSVARATISISAVLANAAKIDARPNATAPISRQLASADAVTERAHGDERARHHEAVDIDNP